MSKFIDNANFKCKMGMTAKNVKRVQLNTKIVSAVLNTHRLKMI